MDQICHWNVGSCGKRDHVSIDSKRGADFDPVAAQTHGLCRGLIHV